MCLPFVANTLIINMISKNLILSSAGAKNCPSSWMSNLPMPLSWNKNKIIVAPAHCCFLLLFTGFRVYLLIERENYILFVVCLAQLSRLKLK